MLLVRVFNTILVLQANDGVESHQRKMALSDYTSISEFKRLVTPSSPVGERSIVMSCVRLSVCNHTS